MKEMHFHIRFTSNTRQNAVWLHSVLTLGTDHVCQILKTKIDITTDYDYM